MASFSSLPVSKEPRCEGFVDRDVVVRLLAKREAEIRPLVQAAPILALMHQTIAVIVVFEREARLTVAALPIDLLLLLGVGGAFPICAPGSASIWQLSRRVNVDYV